MGDELLVLLLIVILERLAAGLDVAREIVIRTVRDAFQLADAEGEFVLQVVRLLGVKGALAIRDVDHVDLVARDADVFVEFQALLEPVIRQREAVLGAAEILDLHLLKLTRAEDVVARIDLIAKRLADLRDAKGQLLARGVEHVAELHEHRLRRLGAEIHEIVVALQRDPRSS